ncbi:DUF3499 domain-containing protein [Propionicimonas sp.]|uniref:DUF3499 domain-containing protein n=1 Tax=Propionicimonas sp. TaxID=1955623 RepID=UPI0039E576AA
MINRRCSRTACTEPAVATLTYVYADSTAVVGPLALRAEPGTYDLCREHSRRLSAPRGWEVIRLPGDDSGPRASSDDLMALADAVRRVGLGEGAPDPGQPPAVSRRKGHLAVLADLPEA